MNKKEALEELDETGKQFFQAASNVEIESNSRSIATGVVSGLGIAKSVVAQIDEPREASWQDAIQFLEDHFGCEIPRNLDQVIEGFNSMSGLMNSVEFELDKQGSNLTSKEFVLEALERYKQKVKVPMFVADWIEEVRRRGCGLADALDCFASPIMPDNIKEWLEFNSSAIGCHHDHQELLARAWLDGYEVEEEPKYRVNIGGLYLKEPLADTNDFTISMTWNKDYAYPFDSWNMAREHTSELGGEVEKV
nr:MAG TPA: Protein of unknown function (DUF1642) [Caudoviricetes sp.]